MTALERAVARRRDVPRRAVLIAGWAAAVAMAAVCAVGASATEGVASFFQERLPATIGGLLALADPTTGLPYDAGTITADGVVVKDTKTSPTNIGIFMAALVAARDRGVLEADDVQARLERIVDSLAQMEKWEGFFFNWYDVANLSSVGAPEVGASTVGSEAQRFVSSVDNANLTAAMMACAAAYSGSAVSERLRELLRIQDYGRFLREAEISPGQSMPRMNHGFYTDRQAFSPFDYGTFMTEARLLTFLALVQNQVPQHPWAWSGTGQPAYMDAMPRVCDLATCSQGTGARVVVIGSWGGSLFEELFPDLFLDEKTRSGALAENHRRAIAVQIDSRNPETGLWGWSPAQGVDCIYKEAGVACLASGGGYPLGDVSPYSVLLAARYAPDWVVLALTRMEGLVPASFDSRFGYCDSVAQDAMRYCADILSLDKGIEAIALCTVLQDLDRAQGIAGYVWQYLDESEAGARGRKMLEDLRFDPRWQVIPAPATCAQGQPLDVLPAFGSAGLGGGGGGCMNDVCDAFEWTASPPAELRYDVTATTAFAYYAGISIDSRYEKSPIDVTAYNALRIRCRGDVQKPSRFKIEVKSGGRVLESFVVEITSLDWQEDTFEFHGALYGAIDEITVAIDHSLASADLGGSLVGRVFVDTIILLCS